MKKILAFDIDGTLNNHRGQIQPGVKSVFTDKRFKNSVALFITGNTPTRVKAVKKQVAQLAGKTNAINFYSSAFGGAVVYDKNFNAIYEKPLCRRKLKKLLFVAEKIEPTMWFLLMQKNTQTFCHIVNDEVAKMIDAGKSQLNMDEREFVFNNEHFSTMLPKLERSYLLNIYCRFKGEEVFKALLPMCQEMGLSIYLFTRLTSNFTKVQMIQITAGKKIRALKYMIAQLKKDGVFDGTIKDVVYFGDCANDVGCLKACDISFARGCNLEEYVIENSKYYADDLTPYLDIIYK